MNINNVEVSVLVNGKPVKLYGHGGKTFICANYGAEYSIKIRNNNYYRIMAVASVDGLSVLDGKPADKEGAGYVLNAYSSFEIKGFRSDQNTVGAFKFTKKKKGYAKEVTGSSENSGIIALAVFAEKQNISWGLNGSMTITNDWYETVRGSTTTPYYGGATFTCTADNLLSSNSDKISCNLNSVSDVKLMNCSAGGKSVNFTRSVQKKEAPDFSAATTWGKKLDDRVVNTTFEKASVYPMAEFNIYYDIRQNLEKIGISFEQPKQVSYPKPFPNGFATPPAGWHS